MLNLITFDAQIDGFNSSAAEQACIYCSAMLPAFPVEQMTGELLAGRRKGAHKVNRSNASGLVTDNCVVLFIKKLVWGYFINVGQEAEGYHRDHWTKQNLPEKK